MSQNPALLFAVGTRFSMSIINICYGAIKKNIFFPSQHFYCIDLTSSNYNLSFSDTFVGNGSSASNEPEDPMPSMTHLEATRRVGITIPCDDFLFFSAANYGNAEACNVTLQIVVDCIKELLPKDCLSLACTFAKNIIMRDWIKTKSPGCKVLPTIISTLRRKFCVGKDFLQSPQSMCPTTGTLHGEIPLEMEKSSVKKPSLP